MSCATCAGAAPSSDSDEATPGASFVRRYAGYDQPGEWLKVDLHTHSSISDGSQSIESVVEAAVQHSCDAIAITDHADRDQAAAGEGYFRELHRLRRQYPKLIILSGLEWNVPPHGGDEHVSILIEPTPDEAVILLEFKERFDDLYRAPQPEGFAGQALRWLTEKCAATNTAAVVFYNHPSRKRASLAPFAEEFAELQQASPLLAGFEGAPGHQAGPLIGAYDGPVQTADRWDPTVSIIGGVWDQLLVQGFDVWAALAASDFHSARPSTYYDFLPGQFSETWVYVRDRSPRQLIEALRQGAFFAAHGHIAREVQLSVSAPGLPRPAQAGETIAVARNSLCTVGIDLTIPAQGWDGSPNAIDQIEVITSRVDEFQSMHTFDAVTPGQELRVEIRVPPGGVVVRARGRRVVESGPDLVFMTNPIRIRVHGEIPGTAPVASAAGWRHFRDRLHAGGVAGLMIGIPLAMVAWAMRLPRGVWKHGAIPNADRWRHAWHYAYFALLGGSVVMVGATLLRSDYSPMISAKALIAYLAAGGVMALAPWRPLLGPLAYAIASYTLPREDAVTHAFMATGADSWITVLSLMALGVRSSENDRRLAWRSNPVAWSILAFSTWIGVVVLAAIVNGHPIGDDLIHRSVRLLHCCVLFFVALLAQPKLLDIQIVVAAVALLLGVRAVRFTSGLRLEQNLAVLVAVTVPWTMGLVFASRRWFVRLASLGLTLCLTALCVLIANRGAFVALLGAAVVVWAASPWRWRAAAVAAPICLVLALLLPQTHIGQRIDAAYGDGDFQGSAAARFDLWLAGVSIAREHPVFGVGPENYGPFMQEYFAPHPTEATSAHNMFLDVAAEAGFVGIALFAAIWLCGSYTLATAAGISEQWTQKALLLGALASVWVYLIAGAFLSVHSLALAYVLLGVGVAVAAPVHSLALAGSVASCPARSERRLQRGFDLAALLYAALVMLGSLTPFQFQMVGLQGAAERFASLRWWPPDLSSRVDFASNVMLFVPLGLLFMASMSTSHSSWPRNLLAALIAVTGCGAFGASVEYLQCWFADRTVSANDVYAQVLGSAAGIALWRLLGWRLLERWRRGGEPRSSLSLAQRGVVAYAVALLLWMAWPLEVTLHPRLLYRKYRNGLLRPILIDGDSLTLTDALPMMAIDALLIAPLGWLAAGAWLAPGQRRSLRSIIAIGVVAALGIETLRMAIPSQSVSLDQTIVTLAGFMVGVLVQRFMAAKYPAVPCVGDSPGAEVVAEHCREDSRTYPWRSMTKSKTRTWTAIGIASSSLLLAVIAGEILPSCDVVPYNVREIFATNGAITGTLLWLSVALYGGAAWALGRWWQRQPLYGAMAILPATAAVTAITYVALNAAVPAESLDDVVGTPVLEMSSFLERGWRFVGLLAAPFVAWTLGIRAAFSRFRAWDLLGVLACAVAFAVSYAVVVLAACTDNLIELLPNNGNSWRVALIPAWLALSGIIAAVIVSPQETLQLRFARALSVAVAVLSAVPAWALANGGFASSVDKYESRFTGLQFLLSASRSHYAAGWELFARFCVLYWLIVGIVAACGFVVEAFADRTSRRRTTAGACAGNRPNHMPVR